MVRRLFVAAMICGLGLQAAAYADDSAATQASDAEITDRVAQKLLHADGEIAPHIRVSTVNGVVTLEGTVFNNAQAVKALKDAGSVTGVAKVQNRLRVRM